MMIKTVESQIVIIRSRTFVSSGSRVGPKPSPNESPDTNAHHLTPSRRLIENLDLNLPLAPTCAALLDDQTAVGVPNFDIFKHSIGAIRVTCGLVCPCERVRVSVNVSV